MVGKDCVAIACDLRLGNQALTVSNTFPKIFNYGDTYLGLTGLATDVLTVSDLFRYKVNMYRLREERDIEPKTMANLVSSTLYEKRFGPYFVSPVIAGLSSTTGKPFICGFDSIGWVVLFFWIEDGFAGKIHRVIALEPCLPILPSLLQF